MLAEYLAITGITALASFHCAGMCGGFAVAIGARAGGIWSNAGRQVIYSAGRLTTYLCLGALAGLAGAGLSADGRALWVSATLSAVAGVVMVLLGLHLSGLARGLSTHLAFPAPAPLRRLMAATVRLADPAVPYALGVLTGLLPCGLVTGWLAKAASSGSALEGLLTMVFFGLGTVPMMLVVGLFPAGIAAPMRARLVRVSGILLLAFGLFTLARGVAPLLGSARGDGAAAHCHVVA